LSLSNIADYTLKRELGQGGMGTVYLARSSEGQDVALKTIIFPQGLNARARWEAVERFQREARAARSLTHDNICQVLDTGADGETFFIVMEFLDGQSLRERIDETGSLPVERSVQIMFDVCDALAYAHDQGIVHRDIKPDNIMVLRGGRAKIMDFGLASIVYETGMTQTGAMMGTISYMSPEQTRGEKLDARSDIFSLGVTFYEMLTGRRAFEGEAPGAVLHAISNTEVEPVSGLPPTVSRTLNKCLRKQPSYRFQNVSEIIAALRTTGIQPVSEGAQKTVPKGTIVMPGSAPSASVVPPPPPPAASTPPPTASTPPPAAKPAPSPVPSATPPPAASAGKSTPSPLSSPTPPPAASAGKQAGFKCSKCGEWLAERTASCWKCGTPNPAISVRKSRSQSQSAISEALQSYKPPKKRGWFGRRR